MELLLKHDQTLHCDWKTSDKVRKCFTRRRDEAANTQDSIWIFTPGQVWSTKIHNVTCTVVDIV